MDIFVYVLQQTVMGFLMFLQFAMLARAILSWLPIENRLVDIVYAVTEPFIYPFRRLFEKMNWFQGFPLDMAFLASYIAINVLSILLSAAR